MAGPDQRAAEVDWSIIFDLIASEYGYTWEQFTGLTYKLLNACIKKIDKRKYDQAVFLAKIHGAQLKNEPAQLKPPSEELLKYAEAEALKTLKQKQEALRNGKR